MSGQSSGRVSEGVGAIRRWLARGAGLPRPRCDTCRHFRDGAADLERAFGNLASMSSGHASVRGRDGVCEARGLYLSAASRCEDHAAA